MKRKLFNSIVLVVSIMLVLATGANAQGGVPPITPGPTTSLPDYIGAPAKPHPLPNSGIPQDPYLAPNPNMGGHSDAWMSDTADLAGPLGRDPVISSTTLPGIHEDWLTPAGSMGFDSHGRPVVNLYGPDWARVAVLDPDTLEVVTSYPLVASPGLGGEGDQQFPLSVWSIYGYVDNRDQIHMVSESKYILRLAETGSPEHPELALVGSYDLSQLVGPAGDRITGAIMDFQGRYWLNLGTSSKVYLFNPKTATFPYTDLPYVTLDLDGDGDEKTRNGLALTREGAAYIVTTEAMYRVDAGADDQPHVVWSQAYDSIGGVRSGQYELGSGTTPTVLGEGKYVAITDNARQLQVVVYRTDAKLKPGEKRVVCAVPVFCENDECECPDETCGAQSNSLVGIRNSLVVQNTADYLFDWETGKLEQAGQPGVERIDIDPNGKDCTKVWANKEVVTNLLPKLSTRTGLIYTHDRKYDAANDLYAVYWAALDFRTGDTVWEKLAGTFPASELASFDNWWAPMGIGSNGAVYASVYGGVVSLRDGD